VEGFRRRAVCRCRVKDGSWRYFPKGGKVRPLVIGELVTADNPHEIDMVAGARDLLIEDWNRFCVASNGTEDCPFEARHTENAIRIALVLHAFLQVEIKKRSEGTYGARMFGHEPNFDKLDEQTVRNALQIRDWFNRHQDALRTPQRAAADDDAWHKAQAMMRDRSAMVGITARDLYSGRRVCGDSETAQRC
jgi:hypothetical protein